MNVLTPVQRQLNMSRIRSRDTQPGWRVVMAWECALQGRTGLATGCALARVSNFIGTDTGMLLSVSGVEALSFPRRVLSGEIGNWCSDSSTKSGTGEHEEEQRLLRAERIGSVGPRLSVAETV